MCGCYGYKHGSWGHCAILSSRVHKPPPSFPYNWEWVPSLPEFLKSEGRGDVEIYTRTKWDSCKQKVTYTRQIDICTHINTCKCKHIHPPMHTYQHAHIPTCTHTYMYTYMHVHIHAWMHAHPCFLTHRHAPHIWGWKGSVWQTSTHSCIACIHKSAGHMTSHDITWHHITQSNCKNTLV